MGRPLVGVRRVETGRIGTGDEDQRAAARKRLGEGGRTWWGSRVGHRDEGAPGRGGAARPRPPRGAGGGEAFTTRLNGAAIGRPVDALVDLQLAPGSPWAGVDSALRENENVVDAVHLTGGFDYQIRVRSRTIGDLDELLRWLKESLGVRETSTRIVLHTVDGFPREPAL
jgi:Lrp/AsnC family leucine-responsive transcriptional regulator